MKILYVSHTHPPEHAILKNVGGMQRVSMQLIQELNRRPEVEVVLSVTNVSGKGTIAFQTIFFLLKHLFTLPGKVRKSGADIVVFSSMVTASLARFLRNKVDVPMVTINHGRDVTLPVTMYQKFVPKIFESLDGVISVSRATREECIKRGMDPAKGVALPNGFDFQKLKAFPGKEESRTLLQGNFGIPLEGRHMLLTVGRMVKRKGHEWFIRNVMPQLPSETVYVIIGDGPEEETVRQAREESPCRERIFLLGRQPDAILKKAYAASDLFVMPNIPVQGDMEGFGIVLLEANMARSPAVAADLEGIKDVITDGKNGWRVPALEPELFAGKINEVLSGDLESFSEEARNFVQAYFSWERVADRYIDFFRQVIERFKELNSLK